MLSTGRRWTTILSVWGSSRVACFSFLGLFLFLFVKGLIIVLLGLTTFGHLGGLFLDLLQLFCGSYQLYQLVVDHSAHGKAEFHELASSGRSCVGQVPSGSMFAE